MSHRVQDERLALELFTKLLQRSIDLPGLRLRQGTAGLACRMPRVWGRRLQMSVRQRTQMPEMS